MAWVPSAVMPRKVWGPRAERIALIATPMLPSVAFLNPTGAESPLAISRCVWDSLVRAPIAYQAMRSPRYCGAAGSSASVAAGTPSAARSTRNRRARPLRVVQARCRIVYRAGTDDHQQTRIGPVEHAAQGRARCGDELRAFVGKRNAFVQFPRGRHRLERGDVEGFGRRKSHRCGTCMRAVAAA